MTGNMLSLTAAILATGIEVFPSYPAIQQVIVNREAQRELQLALTRVLNNGSAGITVHQKQLALLNALEELTKLLPPDCQSPNVLAVMATLLLGPGLLIAVSGREVDPEGLH